MKDNIDAIPLPKILAALWDYECDNWVKFPWPDQPLSPEEQQVCLDVQNYLEWWGRCTPDDDRKIRQLYLDKVLIERIEHEQD